MSNIYNNEDNILNNILNKLSKECTLIKENDSDTLFKISEMKKDVIIKDILNNYNIKNTIDITDDIYKDTQIDKWIYNLPDLYGSKILIEYIIKHPINDKNKLEERQKAYIKEVDFSELKKYEKDVLWIYTLNDEIKEESTLNFLYFSGYILDYINYIGPVLDFYHYYKILIIPFFSLMYPISTIYAPYYYLKKHTLFNMSFKQYIFMILSSLKYFLKFTGNIKIDLLKIVSIFLYIFVYIYNIYQTFVIAIIVYKLRQKLYKKIENFTKFLNKAIDIISITPDDMWKPFNIYEDINMTNILDFKIQNTISNVYRIWKTPEIKKKVTDILKVIYIINVVYTITKLKEKNDWSITEYVTTHTKLWNMKNPILLQEQISNPVNIEKNIIITGPNAGGKTTYIKSILSNIILSQTIGITYSKKSKTIIYDCINSFMRINDILGSKSYFEMETEYCSKMIKIAKELNNNGKKGLFLMDEPMHSTPPIEGMSTAYAVAEYIGGLEGIRLLITTHFHKLIDLEQDYPDKFINISVNAEILANNNFNFTYKIRRGYSKQCIALELLEKQKFPLNVIESAIKMKNKLCDVIYSNNNNK